MSLLHLGCSETEFKLSGYLGSHWVQFGAKIGATSGSGPTAKGQSQGGDRGNGTCVAVPAELNRSLASHRELTLLTLFSCRTNVHILNPILVPAICLQMHR